MKIERTINGAKFNIELLPDELVEAYYEQQRKFDIENLIEYGESMGPNDIEEDYGITYSEFLSLKNDIADLLRENLDMGTSFLVAVEDAIDRVVKQSKAMAM